MKRYGIIRDGVVVAMFHDQRTLAECQAAFADIAPLIEPVPAEAQCGWVRADKGFAPRVTADAVPAEVTNFQARAALLAAGLFETVDNAVRAQGANSAAFQAWEYANHLTRNGALVNSMGKALGLTDADIDDLFRAAALIEA